MAGDFNKPVVGSTYTNFPAEIRDNEKANARMNYEADADANVPDGAMQFNRTDGTFEQLETGVWVPKGIKSAGLDADAASRSTLLGTFSYYVPTFGYVGTLMPVPETRYFFAGGFAGAAVFKITIPKAAKITQISMDLSAPAGSGKSISVDLGVESSYTLTPLTVSGAVNNSGYSTVSKAVTAGQRLEATISSAAVDADTAVVFKVWGHFTGA